MAIKPLNVIIVGTGILGSSIAYHLARLNVRVTVIEKSRHPATEITEKSFAWIVDNYDEHKTSLNIRSSAIADWHRIEKEFNGQLKIDWQGSLMWLGNNSKTKEYGRELINMDHKIRILEQKEISLLEPNLKIVPDNAIFAPNEGSINPVSTSELFLEAAREAGANIQMNNEFISFITTDSKITGVNTKNGIIHSQLVVLAAGAETINLCKQIGVTLPVCISPSILMKISTDHRFVKRIVSNPSMEVRAASENLLLAAEDYIDESIENCPQAIAIRTIKSIKEHWFGAHQIELEEVLVGRRPLSQDGKPIIGHINDVNGLYVSVIHPGVTMAPIAGRLIAGEIVCGQDTMALNAYRPGRSINY
ncbi:hypothetical protein A0256_00915 [Mucilaginibacter sp. PAMC 26640]|nr:hypothetical protein A0256_00915 [Mucilaginibacter sp. PAMC 26640]